MLKNRLLILLLILVSLSFAQDDHIIDQVKKLHNDSLKTFFLETIFYEDQSIRNEWLESINSDSLTHSDVLSKVRAVDSLSLIKIDCYLEHYRYPSTMKLSSLAVLTPWLVIHHATHNEVRIKNYHILLNACLAGDLREEELKMYMARTLSIEKGKEYDFFYTKDSGVLRRKMKRLYRRYNTGK